MDNSIQGYKQQIKSTISAIQSINDDPSLMKDDAIQDSVMKDLPSVKGLMPKKLSDLKSKLKKKKENATNVFNDLCEIAEPFLGTAQKLQAAKYKLPVKNRLRQIAEESLDITMRSVQQIILEASQETLFAGDGICGSETLITTDAIELTPDMFDFMNVLSIDQFSKMGQVLYEDINDIGQQFNRQLHSLFTDHNPFDFKIAPEQKLFTVYWDDPTQSYKFSGLTGNNMTVGKFLKNYFSNIHIPKKPDVIRMVILLLSMGDDNSLKFDISVNELNRILAKIFANCGSPKIPGLNQNEPQFNENDENIEFFFDFDDVEGIDLDDEARRFRKVMKFVDCNNFEYPINKRHLEDFVYVQNDDLTDKVDNFLENLARDAHNNSDSGLNPEDFHFSISSNFILQIPYAMIAAVLTPKLLLPIIMIYKLINGGLEKIKDLMKKLYKLFFKIIRKLFWKFINEFWKRIKKDLLDFLKLTALNILKEKFARYYAIVASLIALLKKILDKNFDNCQALYKLIIQAIDTALSAASFSLNIPGFLLSLADMKSGYSQTRALMNITKLANKKGVNTSPIFGVKNELNDIFHSIIKGHDQENSANSKIVTGNKAAVIPIPGLSGPLILPPGIIKTAGVKL